eukprot:SAG31_NODE_13917_length_837_cov_2.447154_1_plen_108_part_10
MCSERGGTSSEYAASGRQHHQIDLLVVSLAVVLRLPSGWSAACRLPVDAVGTSESVRWSTQPARPGDNICVGRSRGGGRRRSTQWRQQLAHTLPVALTLGLGTADATR